MEPDKKAYIAVMEEIKFRMDVVQALHDKKINVLYKATHVESMVLQVRMITELVALASLAANKSIFEENKKKFEKHWHPKEILKDVEGLNPDIFFRAYRCGAIEGFYCRWGICKFAGWVHDA